MNKRGKACTHARTMHAPVHARTTGAGEMDVGMILIRPSTLSDDTTGAKKNAMAIIWYTLSRTGFLQKRLNDGTPGARANLAIGSVMTRLLNLLDNSTPDAREGTAATTVMTKDMPDCLRSTVEAANGTNKTQTARRTILSFPSTQPSERS